MHPSCPWFAKELLAFDLETTGVDRFDDVPVSYALVTMSQGSVVSTKAAIVDPGREVPAGASAVHGITTEQAQREGVTLQEAVATIAHDLLDASARGVPVVGMKLDYDLTMLDCCYRRQTGRALADDGFQGPVIDVLVLDRHFDRYRRGKRTLVDLCAHYGVEIGHAHDATADATASLEVLAAMCDAFGRLRDVEPDELHRSQVEWHRAWAVSFSSWRQEKGMAPLDDHDCAWPIAVREALPLAATTRAAS